jgi:hypothetical protein
MDVHVIVLTAELGLWTGQAAVCGYAATRKGRSFNAWTVAGLLAGPLAIVAALLVPRRRLVG